MDDKKHRLMKKGDFDIRYIYFIKWVHTVFVQWMIWTLYRINITHICNLLSCFQRRFKINSLSNLLTMNTIKVITRSKLFQWAYTIKVIPESVHDQGYSSERTRSRLLHDQAYYTIKVTTRSSLLHDQGYYTIKVIPECRYLI